MNGAPSFREEPYRVFFPLAFLAGAAGVWTWLRFARGGPAVPATHFLLMTAGYVGLAAGGFLTTALPRLTGTRPATRAEFALLLLFALALVSLAAFAPPRFAAFALALYLLFLALSPSGCAVLPSGCAAFSYLRPSPPGSPDRFRPRVRPWIELAIFLPVLGAFLYGRNPLFGKVLLTQGFFWPLILAVSSVIGPRILGGGPACRFAPGREPRISPFQEILGAAALVTSFGLEGAGYVRGGYLLRAAAFLHRAARGGVLLPPRPAHPQALFYWVSVVAIPLGLVLAGVFPDRRVAFLHISFLAGVSLMVLTVATRVTLAHGGAGEALARPYWWGYGGLLLLATAARVTADLFPERYLAHLGASAVLWIAAHLVWFAFAGRFLGRR